MTKTLSFHRKVILFILASLLTFQVVSAQYVDGFVPGFIITNEGDTTKGYVKIRKDTNESLKNLRYKQDMGSKLSVLSPSKIKGFIIGNYTFLSRKTAIGNHFWLLLLDGPVRVLEQRKSFNMMEYQYVGFGVNGVSMKIATNGKKLPEPRKKDTVFKLLEKETGGPTVVYRPDAKKIDEHLKNQLVRFFSDSPYIDDVIKVSDYQISDIPLMVYCYNQPEKYKLLPLKNKKNP